MATNSASTSSGPGLSGVGGLRLIYAALVLLCLPMVFLSDLPAEGWALIPTVVAPAAAAFMVWALLFDMLMAKIFLSQIVGTDKRRYRYALALDAGLILALLVFWGPFFWNAFT